MRQSHAVTHRGLYRAHAGLSPDPRQNAGRTGGKCAIHTQSHTGGHTRHTLGCLLTLGKTLAGVGGNAPVTWIHTQRITRRTRWREG